MPSINQAFAGVRWVFALSILQKITTFTLNQSMIYWTSPEVFGLASIQLELLLSTLLFLSREGIRIETLKLQIVHKDEFRDIVNISWLPSLSIILVVFAILCMRVSLLGSNIDKSFLAAILYCLGALFEAMGEPWRNVTQALLVLEPRFKADILAMLARSIVTFVTVAYLDAGILGFGFAQLAYGLCHFLVLVVTCSNCVVLDSKVICLREFLPRPRTTKDGTSTILGFFNTQLFYSACSTTFSSLLKHGLTEADKIILSFFSTSYDQGIFAVASNYGSLVTRTLFLPIEEATRLAFSKLSKEVSTAGSIDDIATSLMVMSSLLGRLLRAVAIFGALFPIFGAPYAPVVVQFALGSKWRSDEVTRTLACYCLYICALGINGVSEAFVYSTTANFRSINTGIVASSVVYLIFAVPLISYFGTSGVILAGFGSMAVRIVFSLFAISKYFREPHSNSDISVAVAGGISNRDGLIRALQERISRGELGDPVQALMPSSWVAAGAVAASAIAWGSAASFAVSDHSIRAAAQHVAVGAATGLSLLALLLAVAPPGEITATVDILRGRISHPNARRSTVSPEVNPAVTAQTGESSAHVKED